MTDLINEINNLDGDKLKEINNKYSEQIKYATNENEKKCLGYIIDVCVNYLKDNYNHEDSLKKIWSVVAVRRLFNEDYIDSEEAIKEAIKLFVKYWDNNYDEFVKENGKSYKNDYLRDSGFVHEFVYDVKKEMQ